MWTQIISAEERKWFRKTVWMNKILNLMNFTQSQTEIVYVDIWYIRIYVFGFGEGIALHDRGGKGGGSRESTKGKIQSFGGCELLIPPDKPGNSRGGINKLGERFNGLGAGITDWKGRICQNASFPGLAPGSAWELLVWKYVTWWFCQNFSSKKQLDEHCCVVLLCF